MSGNDELVKRLTNIGLTPNEARCYVALLEIAPATAAEVADASGVPRPKIYATMKALEQRGFCFAFGTTVTTFRPVDPELALNEWIRGREHERRLHDDRDRLTVKELVTLLPEPPESDSDSLDTIMRLAHGPDETVRLLDDLVDNSASRLDIIHATPVFQPESEWNVRERAALRRGVRVRVLVPTRQFAEDRRSSELAQAGAEIRQVRSAALKLIIRDGVEAIVTLGNPNETQPSTVVIRHADLVAPLQLLFNREWRRATPLYR